MLFFPKEKKIISSNNIFEYSDEFLQEVVNELIKLKSKKNLDLKNNEFENKLKSLMGKNFDLSKAQILIKDSDKSLENYLKDQFRLARNERIKVLNNDRAQEIERRIFLQSIDLNWKSHIQYLEQLRQVIGLRSYGQRDPLIEYKKEAFELFENLLNKLKLDFITILFNLRVNVKPVEREAANKPKKIDPKYIGKKMSRNEPCFCGSGKKYKRCCGAL